MFEKSVSFEAVEIPFNWNADYIDGSNLSEYDTNNKKNDFYTDKEQGSMPYGGIVFAICKMFEQSIDHDIKEGFTKSIVDSKERTKEYRIDSAMGIHHGM